MTKIKLPASAVKKMRDEIEKKSKRVDQLNAEILELEETLESVEALPSRRRKTVVESD